MVMQVASPSAVRAPGPAQPGAWALVLLLGVGTFAMGTATFVVAGVMPDLAADLGVGIGTAGLTVTAYAVAAAVGAPVLGVVVGGRPLRHVLVTSLVLFAAGNALSAVAPSLDVLLVTRVLSALAASAFVPTAGAAAIAAVPADRRGRALSVVLGGVSTSMLAGAPLGVLLAASSTWRAAFLFVAALSAVAVVGLLRGMAAGGPAGAAMSGQGVAAPLRSRLAPLTSPAVTGSLVVTVLLMSGSNALYTYLGPVFQGQVGASGLGLLIAVFGVGGLVGTWGGGAAADRWGGTRTLLAAAAALTATFAVAPLVVQRHTGSVLCIAVWSMAAFATVPGQQHRLVDLAPGPAPLVLALISSANNLGFAVGSLAGGAVVASVGAPWLWALATACCGAGLVLHSTLLRGGRR